MQQQDFSKPDFEAQESWAPGSWSGDCAGLDDAWHLMFPHPKLAISKTTKGYRGVVVTTIDYNCWIKTAIVMSTMPIGRTVNEEMGLQLDRVMRVEEILGYLLNVKPETTLTGNQLIASTMKYRATPPSDRRPYPLVHVVYKEIGGLSSSISAHRVFVLNGNRIEIAVLSEAPRGAIESKHIEACGLENSNMFADAMYKSLILHDKVRARNLVH